MTSEVFNICCLCYRNVSQPEKLLVQTRETLSDELCYNIDLKLIVTLIRKYTY